MVFAILFSFSISVYAADGTENINTLNDLSVKAEVLDGSSGDGSFTDVTENLTIYNINGGSFDGFVGYKFPLTTEEYQRLSACLYLGEDFSFNSSHEYSLFFQYGVNVQAYSSCTVYLNYLNASGNLLKSQIVVQQDYDFSTKINSIDIDFKPDVSDLESGYKCELMILFSQSGVSTAGVSQVFYISSEIELVDKDDNSSWLQKIINKINDVWESVKELPEKIGVALGELGDNIIEGLKSLFIPEDGFFDAKKQEMETFLEDHFGVIFTAPNILITIIEKLLTVEVSEPIISFPKIQFDLLGTEYSLIDKEIHLNLSDFVVDGSPYHILYKFYRAFATGFLIVAFANYCKNKYDYLFGKDGEAV